MQSPPYLLRDLAIERPNPAWAADITSIPMRRGFLSLFAVIDGFSRRVLAWRLSNTLTTDFCRDTVREVLHRHGCPEIFNTDQGGQFTSDEFTGLLKAHDIWISRDGQGSWRDHVFVERLWKRVQYEEGYLKADDPSPMRKPTWPRICVSTTSDDRIVPWRAKRRTRPISQHSHPLRGPRRKA